MQNPCENYKWGGDRIGNNYVSAFRLSVCLIEIIDSRVKDGDENHVSH